MGVGVTWKPLRNTHPPHPHPLLAPPPKILHSCYLLHFSVPSVEDGDAQLQGRRHHGTRLSWRSQRQGQRNHSIKKSGLFSLRFPPTHKNYHRYGKEGEGKHVLRQGSTCDQRVEGRFERQTCKKLCKSWGEFAGWRHEEGASRVGREWVSWGGCGGCVHRGRGIGGHRRHLCKH